VLHLPGHTPGHLGLWDPHQRVAVITDAAPRRRHLRPLREQADPAPLLRRRGLPRTGETKPTSVLPNRRASCSSSVPPAVHRSASAVDPTPGRGTRLRLQTPPQRIGRIMTDASCSSSASSIRSASVRLRPSATVGPGTPARVALVDGHQRCVIALSGPSAQSWHGPIPLLSNGRIHERWIPRARNVTLSAIDSTVLFVWI
jgi:hypothetical protein